MKNNGFLGLFFAAFLGQFMGINGLNAQSIPEWPVIKRDTFQVKEWTFVSESFNYTNGDFAELRKQHVDTSAYGTWCDTLPSELHCSSLKAIKCPKSLKIDNSNQALSTINAALFPPFPSGGDQYERNFPQTYQGMCEWMDSNASASQASIDFNVEYAGVKGDYMWFITSWGEYYCGAAHPNSMMTTYIFNTQNGTVATLENFVENSKFGQFLSLLKMEYLQTVGMGIEDWMGNDTLLFTNNISFNTDGLVCTYSPYEVASYAQGYVDLQIEWAELFPLLTPDGRKIAKEMLNPKMYAKLNASLNSKNKVKNSKK